MRRWLLYLIVVLLYVSAAAAWAQESRPNRVLFLDGDGDYVEMADSEALNDIGSQVTMEAWIKPTAFTGQWISIAYKGDEQVPNTWQNRSYTLWLNSEGFIHLSSAPEGAATVSISSPPALIALNAWHHVAGVIDAKNGVMRIFINGANVAQGEFGMGLHMSALPFQIGDYPRAEEGVTGLAPYTGLMDEVRIWNIARNQEEIRAAMFSALSGKEPGLVGYWRFDHLGSPSARIKLWESLSKEKREGTVVDSSPGGVHGKLIGDAHFVEAELPKPVLSGIITDESGQPISGASVRLEKNDSEIGRTPTDDLGSYLMAIQKPVPGLYDVSAGKDERGSWRLGIPLAAGEQKTLDLTLKENISIEGTLFMLDDRTPHVTVPVQAIRNGKVIATALSDAGGRYKLINLKPGRYQVRCQISEGYLYHGEEKARSSFLEKSLSKKGVDESVGPRKPEDGVMSGKPASLQVEVGKTLRNIDFRFAPFKKGTWKNYASFDGLPYNVVRAIYRDPDGALWVGTGWHGHLGGVSRYDGTRFVTLSSQSGLTPNNIRAIHRGPDGVMWFATNNDGVYRYDGKELINFTTEDGLVSNRTFAIHRDQDGVLWFGTWSGVSRYDGKEFINFTTEDGLLNNLVVAIYGDSNGVIWFATEGGGVSRYDGNEFINFTTADGLADNAVASIHRDPDGVMWFGTGVAWFGEGGGGVSRYDGKAFVNFTTKDGLASNCVLSIHRDPDGVLWFGTDSGVSRYDGKTFVNFTTNDGLAHNVVFAIYTDTDGAIWFGTGGGLSRYDEEGMVNLTTIDGLVHNDVWTLYRIPDDMLWVGTMGGASRFDGRSFTNFTASDGLIDEVRAINLANDGILWFGTWGAGVYLYDGNEFTKGMLSGNVFTIYRDPNDVMWFGGSGVTRYDGEESVTFTTADGLVNDDVVPMCRMPDGVMWFGTSGGASRYDGKEFINFTTDDGLVNDDINAMLRAPDGLLWFGTAGGLSLYDGEGFTNLTEILHKELDADYKRD